MGEGSGRKLPKEWHSRKIPEKQGESTAALTRKQKRGASAGVSLSRHMRAGSEPGSLTEQHWRGRTKHKPHACRPGVEQHPEQL